MRLLGPALGCALALLPAAPRADECPAAPADVRLLLHDPSLLVARLRTFTGAGSDPGAQATAERALFQAAGCPAISELGKGGRRDVSCSVPGTGDRTIVVGVNTRYDGASSAALIASLAEAVAAAPRRHTYRWVAFSPFEGRDDRAHASPKPKGAMRFLDSLADAERSHVDAMIHIGPMGYGDASQHPSTADDRLTCPWQAAVEAAGLGTVQRPSSGGTCKGQYVARQDIPESQCAAEAEWSGGNDWLPFRRAGIPVFGVHSGSGGKLGGKLDGALYVKSYRALAMFLALADDALSPPPAATPDAAQPPASGR